MRFRQVWHQLFNQSASGQEPQVEQRFDAQGHRYYHFYDPATRKSSAFGSEQEIRVLLDQQRY